MVVHLWRLRRHDHGWVALIGEGAALKCAQECVKRHQGVNVAHEPRKLGQLRQELEGARLPASAL